MLDILMISHNRLEYLKKALEGVFNQTYKDWKLTIWDNDSDEEAKTWLESRKFDNRVSVIYSHVNESLACVTSKVFLQSEAEFVGKVDADTIVPPEWAERLIRAHRKHPFGFLGGFHFRREDLVGLTPNVEVFHGVCVWRKHHIGGCSYIIRREIFEGYEGEGVMGLSEYQEEIEKKGLINGYLWEPILWVEHMEDGRSPHCIKTDEYQQYKLKTRGLTIEQYTQGIPNPNYLHENTL